MAKTGPKPIPITDRFWNHVQKTDTCWLWTASGNGLGYGRIGVGSLTDGTRRRVYAHRLAYELFIGPIPDGLEIDHLCRTPSCVNPAHLELVTHRENDLRGVGIASINAKKMQCIHGHPYDADNTRWTRTGTRRCRICDHDRSSKQWQRAKTLGISRNRVRIGLAKN